MIVTTKPLRRLLTAIASDVIRLPVLSIRTLVRISPAGWVYAAGRYIAKRLINVLKRRSKIVKNIVVRYKIARRKFRILKRRVIKAIPSTVLRVSVRVLPKLRFLPEVPAKPPHVPIDADTIPVFEVPTGTGTGQGIFRPISTGPVRAAGKLKKDVLGVGGRTYRPGTGRQRPRGRTT